MTYLLESSDSDGDRFDLWQDREGADRLTVTVTDGDDGSSAAAYVSRAALIAALGLDDTDEAPETDDEWLARIVNLDEALLLTAVRSILAPEPTSPGGLLGGVAVVLPARDLIDIADRLRRN